MSEALHKYDDGLSRALTGENESLPLERGRFLKSPSLGQTRLRFFQKTWYFDVFFALFS